MYTSVVTFNFKIVVMWLQFVTLTVCNLQLCGISLPGKMITYCGMKTIQVTLASACVLLHRTLLSGVFYSACHYTVAKPVKPKKSKGITHRKVSVIK